jgi:hypothetical protein
LGGERRHAPISGLRAGRYRSNFWDITADVRDESPTITVTEGLVVLDDASESTLVAGDDGQIEGVGGMFHGFEITLTDGDEPGLSGGVYPFAFTRSGDVPDLAVLDLSADLTGTWTGIVHTPMAPLAVTLTIENGTSAKLTTPLGDAGLERFQADAGRVEGEFPLSFPGVGEFQNFLRLEARGDCLVGKTHARSRFGENAMPTKLERT